MGFGFDFTYVFINLLLLGIFFLCGLNVSRGGSYWKNAIICTVAFVFVLGSRYMRGNDYRHYIEIYNYGLDFEQKIFTWYNELLKSWGIKPYQIFYFYAIPFITCGMIFLRRYKQYAKYMFPLFLLSVIYFEEFQIRQALGFSFVFLFVQELFYRDRISVLRFSTYRQSCMCLLYFFIAYHIHTADAYIMIIILLVYLANKLLIPLIISIPAYIIGSYVISRLLDLSFLNNIIVSFDLDSVFDHYVENTDKWFSAEGYKTQYTRNEIVKVIETLGTVSFFYLTKVYIKKCYNKRWIICLTNLYIIGTIVKHSFMNLELMNRIGGNLMLFWFAPMTIIFYYRKQIKRTPLMIFCFTFVILYWVYELSRSIYLRDSMTSFIWQIVNYK